MTVHSLHLWQLHKLKCWLVAIANSVNSIFLQISCCVIERRSLRKTTHTDPVLIKIIYSDSTVHGNSATCKSMLTHIQYVHTRKLSPCNSYFSESFGNTRKVKGNRNRFHFDLGYWSKRFIWQEFFQLKHLDFLIKLTSRNFNWFKQCKICSSSQNYEN